MSDEMIHFLMGFMLGGSLMFLVIIWICFRIYQKNLENQAK